MKNLIPRFIHDQYKRNLLEGDFSAAVLFMDISGFTPMTEKLMKQGKEGAEILSDILNDVFEPVIDAIYDRGGFVAVFAGDALTAIFPFGEKLENLPTKHSKTCPEHSRRNAKKKELFPLQENSASLFSSIAIKELFKGKGLQKTRFGEFYLSIKIGLSAGIVNWGIVGTKSRKTYFFKGPAIDGCARSEHQCNKMDIVLDEKLIKNMQAAGLDLDSSFGMERLDDSYFKLVSVKDAPPSVTKHGAILSAGLDPLSRGEVGILEKDVISKFVPSAILSHKYKGEFRDIVSVFISFVEPDSFTALDGFISEVLDEVNVYGAYFNSLDFGDKGGAMLVFFGAPVSYEDSIKRAVNFLIWLKRKFKNTIRAGVTQGTVYAGFVGSERRCAYTCLGDVVNMSARLMMKADFGQVWISDEIKNKTEDKYKTNDLGSQELKGVSRPVSVFELLEEVPISPKLFEGEMVSRELEFEKLKGYCQPILAGKYGGVVYVYGDAGIGKSRLLYEMTEKLKTESNARICVLQTDGMLKKGLNPFAYFFNDYFNSASKTRCGGTADLRQYQETALDRRKVKFAEVYDKLMEELRTSLKPDELEDTIKEITRIRPIIGAVLGLRWEGSVYENIDPKDRPEVTRFAIKEFFKALSRLGPVVLLLEDMHWLDNESQNVFEIFTRQIEDHPIIILASARLNDDGSKPKLKIDKDSLQNEMTLGYLPFESVELFVRNQLSEIRRGGKDKADDNLLSFVFSRTEGNPFYMEQFCLYLMENRLIKSEGGTYKLRKQVGDLPSGINAILIARIDRLSAELKEIAQAASVLGREFEVQILLELIRTIRSSAAMPRQGSATGGREQAEGGRLEHLLSEGITERVWNVLSEIKYIFKHALLRDAVYEMQLKARLRSLHKIAGEAMEKLYPEDKTRYSDIAYHSDKAEQKERAKDYYSKAGDYANEIYQMDLSIEYYNKALALCLELFGEKHPDTATSYDNIGMVYWNKGDYDKALEYYEKAFAIWIELFGEKHKDTAESYNNIGSVYTDKGDYDTALEYHNKALAIKIEVLGEKHPDTALSYNNTGEVYCAKGEYDKALEYHNKAFAIRIELLSEKHPDTAESYNEMGVVYCRKGDYDKALEYQNKALAIWSEILGEKHRATATAYNNIGLLYWNKGDYDKALECHNKALAINIEILGEDHPATTIAYNNIGLVYSNKGDYDKALEYQNKSLAIKIEILGEKHPYTAYSYNSIGNVYREKCDYDKALEYSNKALAIRIEMLGEKHPDTASTYNNIGNVYSEKGDHDKALEYLNKALAIRIEILGEKHPDTARSYNNIGVVYLDKGDYDKALGYLNKAFAIWIELLGIKHPDTATSYNNIGNVYLKKGEYDIALEYHNKALAIRSELLGEKHPLTAVSYNNIGKANKGKGDLSKAMEHYNKALEIYKEMKNEKGIAEVMKNIEEMEKGPK